MIVDEAASNSQNWPFVDNYLAITGDANRNNTTLMRTMMKRTLANPAGPLPFSGTPATKNEIKTVRS